jgi:protein-S-isoprenylcysteine O-methyltransferase Ste14
LSLIGAPPEKLLPRWLGTLAIVAAVFVIRALPDPWRGIVDFAVAAALAWGLVAILRRLPSAWSPRQVEANRRKARRSGPFERICTSSTAQRDVLASDRSSRA